MNDFNALSTLAPLHLGRVSAVPERTLQALDSIEGFLEGLNRCAPAAQRRIRNWSGGGQEAMRLAAVPRADPSAQGECFFLAEAHSTFALDVLTCQQDKAPAALSVCLPLSGAMRVRLGSGEYVAQAQQGLIIDPAEVELTQVLANTHFVEFNLPKSQLLRLSAELQAGSLNGAPRFAPLLNQDLSARLLSMALQAAASLQPRDHGPRRQGLFQRWSELIALTLLDEQAHVSGAGLARFCEGGDIPPAGLQRALDFIDARAQQDLVLADIADAACMSASSLLRLFKVQLDQTPGAFLRQVRLDKARAELCRGEVRSVRELAQRWGFQNASKFAQAYKRRFGEAPRTTRVG